MNITISVPTHNCLNYTKLCVKSLFNNTNWNIKGLNPIRFLAIDNASVDGTKEWLIEESTKHYKFEVEFLDKNYGCARSYNTAFNSSKNDDIVIMINNDIVFSRDWLKNLLAFMELNPQCGVVSSHPIDNHESMDTRLEWFGNLKENYWTYDLTCGMIKWLDYAKRVEDSEASIVDEGVHGCLMAYRRECIDAVGLWDENFIKGYYDDLDWNYRCIRSGYGLATTRSSIIFHHGGTTSNYVTTHEGGNEFRWKNKAYFEQKWNVDINKIGAVCSRGLLWTHPSEGVNLRVEL